MICSFLCGLQREIHSEQSSKYPLDSGEKQKYRSHCILVFIIFWRKKNIISLSDMHAKKGCSVERRVNVMKKSKRGKERNILFSWWKDWAVKKENISLGTCITLTMLFSMFGRCLAFTCERNMCHLDLVLWCVWCELEASSECRIHQ